MTPLTIASTLILALACAPSERKPKSAAVAVDPIPAWGSNHVGKPLPTFVTGDECLFCHRDEALQSWSSDRHVLTMRDAGVHESDRAALDAIRSHGATKEAAANIAFLIGHDERLRFLRRGKAYGSAGVLSASWNARKKKIDHATDSSWDDAVFGERCAGCHAAGVDSKTKAFTTPSLDCFSCHGNVSLDHTRQKAPIHLAVKKPHSSPREEISICGQCHLRGGRSTSTGRPFTNHFVAGDNLLLDYELDFAAALSESEHPFDRHIAENAVDVLTGANTEITCLSCHRVHRSSTVRHRRLPFGERCETCHENDETKTVRSFPPRRSMTCDY